MADHALDRAGKIQTVTGVIDPNTLGITHIHEHIIFDQSAVYYEPHPEFPELGEQLLSLQNRWLFERNPFNNRDNLRFTDVSLAAAEVQRFGAAGGGALLELSSTGMSGDPVKLRSVSEESGVTIVAGTGWYTRQAHGVDLSARSIDDLAAELISATETGIADTDVQAGCFGEIGLSAPIEADELRSLEATIIAHQHTGLGISIHPGMGDQPLFEILDFLKARQVDPQRVAIGHLDCFGFSDYAIDRVADDGYFMAWDNFGSTHFMPTQRLAKPLMHASDGERLRVLRRYIDRGHVAQITIGQDLSCKHDLVTFGGGGYSHIIANVIPMMRVLGFSNTDIDTITVVNPRQFLTIE
ncbi:phosphotriesterase-related protein [Leucobacter luti]|uniref:Phosphotriesterase-related protein n=1 Tax=Leucobacter luti TaxID=340320 RepID=A0A4R6RSG0_9MICO|nr:hypothetical protein [Leucobacter luti]TDP89742.1 phosphotriesterase-related protein [Leucobacter luti]